VYEVLGREAAAAPAGSDGLIFTPWINGVMVPAEDSATKSAFVNQSRRTTRGHYVRAVKEGVAYNMRRPMPHVESFAKTRFEQLSFIGGAMFGEFLRFHKSTRPIYKSLNHRPFALP
jgi:xylulokinase